MFSLGRVLSVAEPKPGPTALMPRANMEQAHSAILSNSPRINNCTRFLLDAFAFRAYHHGSEDITESLSACEQVGNDCSPFLDLVHVTFATEWEHGHFMEIH